MKIPKRLPNGSVRVGSCICYRRHLVQAVARQKLLSCASQCGIGNTDQYQLTSKLITNANSTTPSQNTESLGLGSRDLCCTEPSQKFQ
jgi:hypothetical protein